MLKMLLKIFIYDACLNAFFEAPIREFHKDEERDRLLRTLHTLYSSYYGIVTGFVFNLDKIREIYSHLTVEEMRSDIADLTHWMNSDSEWWG